MVLVISKVIVDKYIDLHIVNVKNKNVEHNIYINNIIIHRKDVHIFRFQEPDVSRKQITGVLTTFYLTKLYLI